jgi:hypothetical protein
MGFGVPLEYWLQGEDGISGITNRLKSRHPQGKLYSPIREEAFQAKMKRHGRQNMSATAWLVVFLEAWWQKHFV